MVHSQGRGAPGQQLQAVAKGVPAVHLELQHAVGAGVCQALHRAGGRVQRGRPDLHAEGRLRDGVAIQVHRHLQRMRRTLVTALRTLPAGLWCTHVRALSSHQVCSGQLRIGPNCRGKRSNSYAGMVKSILQPPQLGPRMHISLGLRQSLGVGPCLYRAP